MNSGFFITVEGGEGAGKTSAIEAMMQTARELGCEALSTREPGGFPLRSRSAISSWIKAIRPWMPVRRLYCTLTARRQHLAEKVIPALEAGKVVICDRFIDSNLAYQGHARGLGIDDVFAINRFAIGSRMPDLTFFMDVRPEIGLARINADKSREVNRLDLESLAFHQKVREGYLLVASRFPERIVRIDAEQELEAVLRQIQEVMNQKLTGRI
ncbi:dTMP kinase [Paenibacillus sp. P25]|nr:dTMP kinase [Paenibacillus sp. P25]